jgi:hypothetical protein
VIPTRIHGAIDYIWSVLLILAPFVFGFTGTPRAVAVGLGTTVIVVSLLTDYEWGVRRLIPMPLHLGLDIAGGLLLAASPWLLGFAHRVWLPLLAFGAASVVVASLTARVPGDAARHRPHRPHHRHRPPARR